MKNSPFIKKKTRELVGKDLTCHICKKAFSSLSSVMTHIGQVEPCRSRNREYIIRAAPVDEVCMCKLCGYIGHRLDLHIKSVHKITSAEYAKSHGEFISSRVKQELSTKLDTYRTELWQTDSFKKLHSSDEIKKKISTGVRATLQRRPEIRKLLSAKAAERALTSTRPINTRFKRGWYTSTRNNKSYYYQSGFELACMEYFDSSSNVIEWDKNSTVKLSYRDYLGNDRFYIYDFNVTTSRAGKLLIETKQYPDANLLYKLYALEKYCKEIGASWKLIKHRRELTNL